MPSIKKVLFFICKLLPSCNQRSQIVYLSFDFCSPGFDALWLLMEAELKRRKNKLNATHVVFNTRSKHCSNPYDNLTDATYHWRLHNMIVPFLALFPAIKSYTIINSKLLAGFHIRGSKYVYPHHPFAEHACDVCEVHKNLCDGLPSLPGNWGIQVQPKAMEYVGRWMKTYVKDRKLIVVTLRYSPDFPLRNSRVEEWARFAASCDWSEYCVAFVMDTETQMDGYPPVLKDYLFCDAASWNVHIRAALYEAAYLNLTINSGPSTLCFFNPKCRFIQFKVTVKGEPRASEELLESFGFKQNKNLTWATPLQKLVWEDDTFEVIQREFRHMVSKIQGVPVTGKQTSTTNPHR